MQVPSLVRPGPPPIPKMNKPKSVNPTKKSFSPILSKDNQKFGDFTKHLESTVAKQEERLSNKSNKAPNFLPKNTQPITKHQTPPPPKKAPPVDVEEDDNYDDFYGEAEVGDVHGNKTISSRAPSVTECDNYDDMDDGLQDVGDGAQGQTRHDSTPLEPDAFEEDDMYDTVVSVAATSSQPKLEAKYDLNVPGTGGMITSADVLNGKADQVGCLFRKPLD